MKPEPSFFGNLLNKGKNETIQTLKTFYNDIKPEDLPFKTDLKPNEVYGFSMLLFMDKVLTDELKKVDKAFNGLGIADLIDKIERHAVSRDRLGRIEAVDVLRGEQQEQKQGSKFAKFMGFGKN